MKNPYKYITRFLISSSLCLLSLEVIAAPTSSDESVAIAEAPSAVPCIQSQINRDWTGLGDAGVAPIWFSCGAGRTSSAIWVAQCLAPYPPSVIGPVACGSTSAAMLKMCLDNAGMGTFPTTTEGSCAARGVTAALNSMTCTFPECTRCASNTFVKCAPVARKTVSFDIPSPPPYQPTQVRNSNGTCNILCGLSQHATYMITYTVACNQGCDDSPCNTQVNNPVDPR